MLCILYLVHKCFTQMAQDFFQIMITIIMEILISSALTSGMFIDEKGKPVLPPPGSPDRPIPPDDYFDGSNVQIEYMSAYAYDTYSTAKGDNAIARGGLVMPYDDSVKGLPKPMLPLPPDRYPMTPPSGNMSQGYRTVFIRQQPDLSYCDVLLKAPVPPPGDQIPWFCICSQCKEGPMGPKGDKGDRGLPGTLGSPGIRGLTGFPGHPGFMGFQGQKGQKGDVGGKGDHGTSGFAGQKGQKGYKGDKGDGGIDGNPGNQGSPGERGDCPTICSSIQGPPGEPGPVGMSGGEGLTGVGGRPGQKGQKGDLGNSGPPGTLGLTGQKGDQGEQGKCHCRDGVDGTNGTTGIPGEKGSKGDNGHQGATGINGNKGQKGDLGEAGVPGPCSSAIQSSFSATLSSAFPVPNLPVPFTNVIYNKGFNFNALRGVYRAPINGTYVMNYHLIIYSKPLKVGLFHNFNPIVKSSASVSLSAASQQVILHLTVGDEVWLQVKGIDSNGMYTSSECSSTFSGFLLYPDSCDMPASHDLPQSINGSYIWGEL